MIGATVAGHLGVVAVALVAEDADGMFDGVASFASVGERRDETYTIGACVVIGVLRVAESGSGTVAEIPEIRGAAAGIGERDIVGFATHGRGQKVGYGKIVVDIDAEKCVVAIVAAIVDRPSAGGCGEVVVAVAACADTLVKSGHFVKSAGATVDVVVAAVAVSAVEFAKEGSKIEGRGIGAHAHDVEILAVGSGLYGIGGCFHARGAGLVPVYTRADKVAAPTGGIDTVANVSGEGRR